MTMPSPRTFAVALALLRGASLSAQDLAVTGWDGKETKLSSAELRKLEHMTVRATDPHAKAAAEYRGVALAEIVRRAGAPLGKDLRGRALLATVVIEAADGYQVAFSLAEIDPEMSGQTVLIADVENGKPLPSEVGALRLVVPNDKKASRWVRQVTRVVVRPGS